MEKILISACLLGELVRFDAKQKPITNPKIHLWLKQGRLLSICPEVAGGLCVPRAPAEIQSDGLVKTEPGLDVTSAYLKGAQLALKLAQTQHCRFALLKAKSPSCGSGLVYDGHFKRNLVAGDGICALLLKKNGIRVFSELQIDELAQCLCC